MNEPRAPEPENVRAVRLGQGANCSSIGSVVDTLFVAAAVSGALFAAVCAAMKEDGEVRVIAPPEPEPPEEPDEEDGA